MEKLTSEISFKTWEKGVSTRWALCFRVKSSPQVDLAKGAKIDRISISEFRVLCAFVNSSRKLRAAIDSGGQTDEILSLSSIPRIPGLMHSDLMDYYLQKKKNVYFYICNE